MLKRRETELRLVKARGPLPTVEVDIGSIPEEFQGYGDLVVKVLSTIAARSPKRRATIYVYQGPSVSFSELTWSAFFGVAGDKKLLSVLRNAFRSAKVNARFSDEIDPSTAIKEFHVEDGYVWRPLELGVWYVDSQDQTDSVEDTDDIESDD